VRKKTSINYYGYVKIFLNCWKFQKMVASLGAVVATGGVATIAGAAKQ
jgi:hypothetical protein